jgi:hypothetical protein
MDHKEAIEAQAVERYLLQELSPAEAQDFELHYFECPQCAQAVDAGSQFIENTKAAFTADTPSPGRELQPFRKPFWSAWLSGFAQPAFALASCAALILGSFALYQNMVVIPAAHRAATQAQPAVALSLLSAARGQVPETVVPNGALTLVLSAILPPDVHSSRYHWKLESADQVLSEATTPGPLPGQPLLIAAPVSALRTAEYNLSIYGMTDSGRIGDKIDIYPFRLKFQSSH